MSIGPEFYERHDLCQSLTASEVCFRAKNYENGLYVEVFHEHVPARRISKDSSINALNSLVACYARWPGIYILHSQLNDRSGGPPRYPLIMHHISYPQPGVMRHYAGAGNTLAWFDKVISRSEFDNDA